MKKVVYLFAVVVLAVLVSCEGRQTEAENNSEIIVDANSGATGLGICELNISPEEGRAIVVAFLKESAPYFFATEENGKPHLRPIGIFMEEDGKVWFHVGKHKNSYAQIQKNPNIEIVSVHPNGEWMRLTGKAVCSDNEIVNTRTFEMAPGLKQMYNEETGHTLGHFYFENGVAEISRKGGVVEQIKF